MSNRADATPEASSETIRKVMQGNRSTETKPEIRLRRALHAEGLRYRKNSRPEEQLRCEADIVFGPSRVCVFVDGCFWHGCPEHFDLPKSNVDWWREKIARNKSRDARQTRLLEEQGWTVLRYWEHDVLSDRLPALVHAVADHVRGRAEE